MDDLRSLRHFVEISRYGSFSEAAARLGLTNAALSKSIARLEKSLGMRLFARTTRSVHLTSEGQLLFDRIAPSFENIEEALDQTGTISAEPVGLVRLSTTTGFGKYWVMPLLPEFLALHPGIDLAVSFHDSGRGLTRQTFDVRINWNENPERNKVAQVLCTIPLTLVGSAEYVARRGMPETPADLSNHECIAVQLPGGIHSRWVFVKRNTRKQGTRRQLIEFTPKGRVTIMDELEAVTHAVRVGLGLAVVSADSVLDALRDGSLVHLLSDYEVLGHNPRQSEVVIQYSIRKHLPLRVQLLVDFLIERLGGRQPLNLMANRRQL